MTHLVWVVEDKSLVFKRKTLAHSLDVEKKKKTLGCPKGFQTLRFCQNVSKANNALDDSSVSASVKYFDSLRSFFSEITQRTHNPQILSGAGAGGLQQRAVSPHVWARNGVNSFFSMSSYHKICHKYIITEHLQLPLAPDVLTHELFFFLSFRLPCLISHPRILHK